MRGLFMFVYASKLQSRVPAFESAIIRGEKEHKI